MQRKVTLRHRFGGTKEGLTGELVIAGKGGGTSKVSVFWPLNGILIFSALTGLEVGSPRGPWRLSEEDVAAFCEELGLKPAARSERPSKRRPPDRTRLKADPRQLHLVEK